MAQEVAGSSPVSHPMLLKYNKAPVAQMDRATDSGSVGRRFESSQAYHMKCKLSCLKEWDGVISSVGRAADS